MLNNYWINAYKNNIGDSEISTINSSFYNYCKQFIKPNKKIVEYGCGNGRDASVLIENASLYIGIDMCNEAVEQCKKLKLKNAIFINESISDNLLDKHDTLNKVDIIYSRFSIHSLTTTECDLAVQNAYNLLVDSGLLLIETRSTNDPRYGQGIKIETEKHAFIDTHYRRFMTIDEMRELLDKHNFIIKNLNEEYIDANYNTDKAVVIRAVAIKKLAN